MLFKSLKNNLGFSLIEVLMALGVFVITATTILPSITQQLQRTMDDEMILRGMMAAKNKMTELESGSSSSSTSTAVILTLTICGNLPA